MIAKPSQTEAAKRLNPLEISTLILSIYVLVALLIQSLVSLPPDAVVLLDWIDLFVCIVFLTDFFVRFTRAPSKLGFLKWGWIDFVSSIPVVGVFVLAGSSELFGSCVYCVHFGRQRIC